MTEVNNVDYHVEKLMKKEELEKELDFIKKYKLKNADISPKKKSDNV